VVLYSRDIWDGALKRGWLNVRIERACRGLNFRNGSKLIKRGRATGSIATRTSGSEDDIPWDEHAKFRRAAASLDPITGELEPATAEHFCTWRVEVDYDPAAKCPWWVIMINDMSATSLPKSRQRSCASFRNALARGAQSTRSRRALSKGLVFWVIRTWQSGPLD